MEPEPRSTPGDLGDLPVAQFRAAAHGAADIIADYLAGIEGYPVFPQLEPGTLRSRFPASPPAEPEPLERLLADYAELVEPNATHWQHPGFLAYFPTTASAPGILAEMLVAGLGQNPMLWRASPIGTELEEVVVDWLRQAFGLPPEYDGLITDTASTSSLIALAAAREAAGLQAAALGLAGRPEIGVPVVYASVEAHSSIDRAAMTLGLGRSGVRRIGVDDAYALRVDLLEAALKEDRATGRHPIAIVATLGTTSSTAVDPVGHLADVAAREGAWLHVDAAYGGAVAVVPERRALLAGWERADSIVVNPHKWLFTPLDASLLLTRRLGAVRDAFSLVPEYLRTLDREGPIRDYSEYQPQLGRRFRALKLWFVIRAFGLRGLAARIEAHCRLAGAFAGWVDADPSFERLAPVPFATVCFRYRPVRYASLWDDPATMAHLDALNQRLITAVNARGDVFLSHTRLRERFAIRVAIGNARTTERHVARAWEILQEEASRLEP